MSITNKNTHTNVYRNARIRASAYNSMFSAMDTTFDLLFIGRRTLWEIETGVSTPDSNTVLSMAELYNAPELITHYCSSDCPLGKARRVQPVENLSTEGIALNTTSLLYKSEDYTRRQRIKSITARKSTACEVYNREFSRKFSVITLCAACMDLLGHTK